MIREIVLLAVFLAAIATPISAETIQVFLEDPDGNPIFVNSNLTIQYYKSETNGDTLVGQTIDGFFKNEKGSMMLFSKYSKADIDYALILEGNSELVPINQKLSVAHKGTYITIIVENYYKLDEYLNGMGIWAQAIAGKMEHWVRDVEGTLPRNIEQMGFFEKGMARTTTLGRYVANNPTKSFFAFVGGVTIVENPWKDKQVLDFKVGEWLPAIPLPAILLFALIGVPVGFLCSMISGQGLLPVLPARGALWTPAQATGHMMAFPALLMVCFNLAYSFTSYNLSKELAFPAGMVLVAVVITSTLAMAFWTRKEIKASSMMAWKLSSATGRGIKATGGILKRGGKISTKPLHYGRDERDMQKILEDPERYHNEIERLKREYGNEW